MIEKDFFAVEKNFIAKKSFSQANVNFFSLGQNFLAGQKIFCPGRWTRHRFLIFGKKLALQSEILDKGAILKPPGQ